MFGRNEQPQEHTVTKTWRAGQESADYIQKLWTASCTCGWTSSEGSSMHVAVQVGAHEVAAEQAQASVFGVAV